MTHLEDLFDLIDLEQAIAGGFVRTQVHPDLPYTVYGYTELAQFERCWTPVTRQCRGLIAHTETGEILARPFVKTHNHNEPEAHAFALDEPVEVTDKVDGSLGIGYPLGPNEPGFAISTRGSFASEQAIHATEVWRTRYQAATKVPDGITPLWEIVYPTNRIVVDYQGQDDLVLLAGVEIVTGRQIDAQAMADLMNWPGPVVERFPYQRFDEALAAPVRPGREGYVIRSLISNAAVKFKYGEYVYLHKIVTGMNERIVWEHLGNGGDLDELITPLPDEFHPWVRGVADRLRSEQIAIHAAAQIARDELVAALPSEWTRKDYALAAAEYGPLRPYLFNLLDGRDPRPSIWKTLRPSGAVTMTGYTEDAA
jgi:RNA ligase